MDSGRPVERAIVVVNAGSSSVKFAVYRVPDDAALTPLIRGQIDGIGSTPRFAARDASNATLVDRQLAAGEGGDIPALFRMLMAWLEHHLGAGRLVAAGHRVVVGGLEHSAPVRVDDAVLARLRSLVPLAPLHQPRNLEPIAFLHAEHPALVQVACFDTAFHRTMPAVAEQYGLPRALTEAGVRRFGFHGLSYEYIAGDLPTLDARAAEGRTIVAHLGSGASLCAMDAGHSVATTMGFSPLSGIVMATRPGEVDPGLLIWLMRERGFDADGLEAMFYHDSGLKGVSGLTGDMRALLASADPHAREAVALFNYRVCREIGSLAAALGGLDALVFTAGIGENAAPVRAAVCEGSAWLGIRLDPRANERGGPRISAPDSAVSVWVVPTNEEIMIARHTAALMGAPRGGAQRE